jgi:hypothetical protein
MLPWDLEAVWRLTLVFVLVFLIGPAMVFVMAPVMGLVKGSLFGQHTKQENQLPSTPLNAESHDGNNFSSLIFSKTISLSCARAASS